jgi:diaminohydroxyphosphoribosylaminopyrimidine deaminase/5-amino-6-(5-phosphoribosylamino)uracil reductase
VNAEEALARACALARRGLGDVEPNPPVGAVVWNDGQVLGEGFHGCFGGSHAEVEALAAAGERSRGATLCVTLEPCSSKGKTPPCVDAVLAAGIARVLVGCADPDPRHQGRGLQRLLAAGVQVDLVDLPEARALIDRFGTSLARRRPHVIAKWAMSRDGAIAPPRNGHAIISCETSRDTVHRWRASLDAIVVGVGTVVADDPQLTARGSAPLLRPLRRVVLDPSLRTSPNCELVRTADETPTWIFAADDAREQDEDLLREAGVVVFRQPRGEGWLESVFATLHLQGCLRVMVEGGSHTLARCLVAGIVDQAAIFIAESALGEGALPAVEGLALRDLTPHEVAEALHLTDCRITRSGDDTLLRGFREGA